MNTCFTSTWKISTYLLTAPDFAVAIQNIFFMNLINIKKKLHDSNKNIWCATIHYKLHFRKQYIQTYWFASSFEEYSSIKNIPLNLKVISTCKYCHNYLFKPLFWYFLIRFWKERREKTSNIGRKCSDQSYLRFLHKALVNKN